jgi:prophage antirepressor-like protein
MAREPEVVPVASDEPIEEARARFAEITKADPKKVVEPEIPDGELQVVLFKDHEIRKEFHGGEWWFSVVDVIGALTGSQRPSKYWSDLKRQLSEKEGFSELSDNIGQLTMPSEDGKNRATEVATTETILRILQSVPSPRAEPFKRWLARVGYERIQETQDPEIAIKRAIMTYQLQGRTDDWIEKRIRTIVARKELTSEWKKRGVEEGIEYAQLTNIISQETFGLHTENHKKVKGLRKSHNLRDHMSDLELILTMLGETSTKEIARQKDARGFYANSHAARDGGAIAGSARKQIEEKTGKPVVSSQNFLGANSRISDPIKLTSKKSGR